VVRDDPIDVPDPQPRKPDSSQDLRRLDWDDGDPAAKNYRKLGAKLAASDDLYCRSGHDGGLLLVRADGSTKLITTAADLAPVIVDRVALKITLEGKAKGSKLSAAHLNAMLRTNAFLSEFAVVDQITTVARYLP